MSPFCGSTVPLFLTSDDISPGFQSQGGSLACVLCRLRAMNSYLLFIIYFLYYIYYFLEGFLWNSLCCIQLDEDP